MPSASRSIATHLYWGGDGAIGRVGLDGSDAEPDWIPGSAGSRQSAVAVAPAHVYWADFLQDSIGRANLDGSGVDPGFIATSFPSSLALDDTHVYWVGGTGGVGGAIARADLDGSDVEPALVGGTNLAAGVAVDDTHLYWTNFGADSIGRANLDGSGADQDFIAEVADPWGIAVGERGIYWTSLETGEVGHANLDGSEIDERFVRRAGALNIALGEPGPIGRVRVERSQAQRSGAIRVRVKVTARQWLSATATGKLTAGADKRRSYGLEQLPGTRFIRAGETEVVRLKPKERAQRAPDRASARPRRDRDCRAEGQAWRPDRQPRGRAGDGKPAAAGGGTDRRWPGGARVSPTDGRWSREVRCETGAVPPL